MHKFLNYPVDSYSFKFLTMGSGVVLIQDGKVLLVRESDESLYSFPGGTIEDNESIEQTAIREAMEEISLDVKLKGEPYIFTFVRYNAYDDPELVLLFHFAASEVSGQLTLGTDAKQYTWKEINDDFSDCFENVKSVFSFFLDKYGSDPGYKISQS